MDMGIPLPLVVNVKDKQNPICGNRDATPEFAECGS